MEATIQGSALGVRGYMATRFSEKNSYYNKCFKLVQNLEKPFGKKTTATDMPQIIPIPLKTLPPAYMLNLKVYVPNNPVLPEACKPLLVPTR